MFQCYFRDTFFFSLLAIVFMLFSLFKEKVVLFGPSVAQMYKHNTSLSLPNKLRVFLIEIGVIIRVIIIRSIITQSIRVVVLTYLFVTMQL